MSEVKRRYTAVSRSKRLDVWLYEAGYFSSRQKAREAILDQGVEVDGKIATKPSQLVSEASVIKIVKTSNPYVGRGGLKLEKALKEFKIDLNGLRALDVGASTGGFTDCMLKNGAAFVCACDVGKGQLHPDLKADPRVLNLEETDIRELEDKLRQIGLDPFFDFIAVDLSFISLGKIIPLLKKFLNKGGKIVCLVKPQFEAGRKNVGKGGIVKDPRVRQQVLASITALAEKEGYKVLGITESPITGGDGNIEYLMCMEQ